MLRKKSNSADQYIWFLIMIVGFFLLLSIFVTLAKISVEVSSIITKVETTSDEVLALLKQEHYGNYIISDKKLNITNEVVSNEEVTTSLADALGADKVTEGIIFEFNDVTEYELKNISYTNDEDCIYLNMSITIPIRFNGNVIFNYKKDLSFASAFTIKDY